MEPDLEYLSNLLDVLISANIKSFSTPQLKLEFHVEQLRPSPPQLEVPVDETSVPQDLRAENINNPDHVLNWSAGPSLDEETPMAGDAPL